jgi:NitT/TauT family transport system permease protein
MTREGIGHVAAGAAVVKAASSSPSASVLRPTPGGAAPAEDRQAVSLLWRILRGKEGLLLWLVLLGVWQALSTFLPAQQQFLFPSPARTAEALWGSLPELGKGTVMSLMILVPGYLLACTTGIVSGILAGTTPRLARTLFPFARVAAPVPPTVYIPYAIALVPTFRLSAIFIVFIGGFWPVFLNSAAGAAAIPSRMRDNARVLGLTKIEYLWRIVLPASLPHIFSGMAVALALSFILLTVAELFGANAGLGRFVQFYADYADYPRMAAGILYTGAITFISMELLDRLKRRLLFWHR